jgi:hypothetical protein
MEQATLPEYGREDGVSLNFQSFMGNGEVKFDAVAGPSSGFDDQ